jgi:GR25 family glycosyltransferase involved in LPS biosynthesis
MKIPIFCINLESSTQRKNFIQERWIDRYGFDIKFWKGVSKEDYLVKNTSKKSRFLPNRLMKDGELGLIYSYINLCEYILDSNLSEVIIMEDDIYPNPLFSFISNQNIPDLVFDYIAECKKEFTGLQLLLMHKPAAKNSFIINEELNYSYLLTQTYPWGAQMNFYTKNGIEKIFQSLKSLEIIVDHYHHMKSAINHIAITKTPIAFHNEFCQTKNKNFISSEINSK